MQRKLANTVFLTVVLLLGPLFLLRASNCQFTIAVTTTDALCHDSANGTATVDPFGNDLDYTYQWNDPNNQTAPTAYGLSVGTYQVVITDLNSCDTTITVNIGQPLTLAVNPVITGVSCNSFCDGSVLAKGTGGTVPYTFQWNDPALQTDSLAVNLCAGTYSVKMTDSHGCTVDKTVTVSEPTAVVGTISSVSPKCYGDCNGTATVSVSGGVLPYSYLWSNGSAIVNLTKLCAGSYSVVITDKKGCKDTVATTLTAPQAIVVSISSDNTDCNNTTGNMAVANVSGGTTPYTYQWSTSPIQTNDTATGLAAGSYILVVKDKNNCQASGNITINNATPVFIPAPVVIQPTCQAANGQITINAYGGQGPLSYSWSNYPLITSNTLSGLLPGTYSVTVFDTNGCSASTSITLTNSYNGVNLDPISFKDVSCYGGTDGSASVQASGGATPYSYVWNTNPVQTTSSVSNLKAGNYKAYVLDLYGCSDTVDFTINQPAALALSSVIQAPLCKGDCNGTATINVNGGTIPYSYSWNTSPIQISNTASNLCNGTYMATVTDGKGCVAYLNVDVVEPIALSVSFNSTAVSCNGKSDGQSVATISGGTAPYTYSWNTSPKQTGSTATGLIAGSYTLTVIDANGCSASASTTISEPNALLASISSTNPLCFGSCIGTATANVSGGTSPYTYSWNTAPIQTTSSALNLCDGTYTVSITDSKGCTATANANIVAPTALTLTTSVVNANCGNNDGQASVVVSGGISPYLYAWSGNTTQSTATAINLTAATYYITVYDNNGCSASDTVVVNNSNPLQLSVSSVGESCLFNDGTASVTAIGGTGVYNYSWNTSPVQTTQTATGLAAGTYTVVVTDKNSNACKDSISVSVAAPPVVSLSFAPTSPSCNGGNNGKLSVTPSGGSSPYSYNWATSPVQTTSTAVNLIAGSYSVTVTDVNGCIASGSATLTQPNVLTVTATAKNASCAGSGSGSVTLSVSGGTTPYSFSWSNGASTSSATGLVAGTYSVTVTDAKGCTAFASATVTEPSAMAAATSSTNAKCYNSCDGTASVTVSGGTGPYSYSWNTSPVKTTSSVSSLCAGNYIVTVTDANGCTLQPLVSITQPDEIKLYVDTTVADCGMDNGKAYVAAIGGTPSYTYSWNTLIPQTGDSAVNLEPGVYSVTATDANGCTQTLPFVISTMTPFYITVLKNNVTKCDTNNGKIEVQVDSGGTAPYTFLWNNGDSSNIITKLAEGSYYVTIEDVNGCDTTALITLTKPPIIKLSGSSINASCGINDGQATVIASGGTGPLTYTWTDSVSSTNIASNLYVGSYKVTVKDTIHCVADTIFVINEPPAVKLTITGKDISCGLDNGEALANVSAGSGTYSILWSNGFSSTLISNLSPAMYIATVNDSNGCFATDSVIINGTQSLLINASIKNPNCGLSDGEIYLSISGGDGIYSYSWQNTISSNDTAQNLSEGTYIVTVNDNSGCSAIDTINVAAINPIVVSLSSFDIPCSGNNNGKIVAGVSGGSGKYIYNWSNGMTTADSIIGLAAGIYYLTVTDFNTSTCFSSDTALINEPELLSINTVYQNVMCHGDTNGKIFSSATGGKLPYNYYWSNNSNTTDSAVNLAAGVYVALVKDSNGCVVSDTVIISEPDSLTLSINIKDIVCGGAGNGELNTVVGGGSFPYSYSWNTNPVQTTSFALNLSPGTYTVVVQDVNGCLIMDSASISQPDTVKVSANLIFGTCKGLSDHGLYAVASGGSGVYSYAWSTSPVETNDTVSGLPGGIYSITVMDSTGCSANDTIEIPSLLTITTSSHKDVSCYGMNDAAIYVFTSGGSGEGTYTYNWNFSSTLNNDTVLNLAPGNYIVSVEDTNGCIDGDTIQIIEPAPLLIALDSINASCGSSNGEVNVLASGGTVPYSYLWSNGSTLANVSGIPKNIYWVDVTDANGCLMSDTILVEEANPIILSMNFTDVLCNASNNGTALVAASGGSGAYSYLWSNGSNASSISNLSPGNYSVTVTDITSSLCSTIDSVTVSEPSALTVSGSANNTCMDMADGAATVVASGGIQPYSYQWSNGGTTSTISNLPAANYIAVVTDSNNCQASVTISVEQPTTIFYLPPTVNPAYCGSSNASIYLEVYANSALSYEWLNDSNNISNYALDVDSGTYYVHIFDSAGCDVSDTIVVNNIDYYPVVVITDSTNLSCIGSNDAMAVATASATNGSYGFEWNTSPVQTTDTAFGLTVGMYIVTVTDSLGCKGYDSIFIKNPDTLKIAFDVTNVSCNGFNNGQIIASVSGGEFPYTYQWSNGDSVSSINNLKPVGYQLTVYDAKNCIVSDSVQLTEPLLPLKDTAFISHVKCFGGFDGKIELQVSGGTQPYQYNWPNTGEIGAADSFLIAGMHYVSITDSNGCFMNDTFVVSEPLPMALVLDSVPATCSLVNGQVSVIASGGTSPYQYLWSNGDTNSIAQNVSVGNYSVTVIDSNGCLAADSVSVFDIPSPVIDSIYVKDNICNSSNNGYIELVNITGAGPFTYSCNAVIATDPLIANLSAGTYTVAVTDTNLCTVSTQVIITEPDSIVLSVQDSVLICYGMNATISATANGGNGIYTYIWDNGLDSVAANTVNPLSSTYYYVVVLDSNGCTSDTASIGVFVNLPLSLSVASDSSICQGEPAVIYAAASGGNGGPYNYIWNGGMYSGDTVTVNPGATEKYIVVVTDNCGSASVQDSVEIIVNPLPITSMIFNGTEGCAPVTFDFSYSTDIGDSIIWNFDDGTFAYDNNTQHTFTSSGTYTVSLTTITSNGCKNTSVNSAQVVVYDSPTANFEAYPYNVDITNPSISFTDQSADAITWVWDFGDSGSSTDINPYHEYADTGIYNVQLIVSNTEGCFDTIVLPVEINNAYIMNIPNAFSPNGDGLNDYFLPVGFGMDAEAYTFNVFDRWGNKIFASNDMKQGWDGTVNGGNTKAPIDVYIWKLHVKDIYGFYHTSVGHVSLIE